MKFPLLHINCNLIVTSLYYGLFKTLSEAGLPQRVWVPHKKYHSPSLPEKIKNVEYSFTGYQDVFDRFLFHRKINKGVKLFESSPYRSSTSVIHAHTLFSDGALAYEINRRFGIPYVVTVRNTDLNVFWRYFPYLRNYGRRIAENASAITFLGSSYRNQMCKQLFVKTRKDVEDLVHVIPNGLDPFWFLHPPTVQKGQGPEIKILFVGSFTKNKNIDTLVAACTHLVQLGEKLTLRLVGAKTPADFVYGESKGWIETLPFCSNKVELSSHYRWADVFVMPSLTETFGLVYAEALSQGTPVVYSKGQGFDGWINDGVCGYGVSPLSAKDIARCIKLLHRVNCEDLCVESSKVFTWPDIAGKYLDIYEKAFLNKKVL